MHTYPGPSSSTRVNSNNDAIFELEGQCCSSMVELDLHIITSTVSKWCQTLNGLKQRNILAITSMINIVCVCTMLSLYEITMN